MTGAAARCLLRAPVPRAPRHMQAEFGEEAMQQARARQEAERRQARAAAAEAVDVNLIPLGAKPAAAPSAPPPQIIPDVEVSLSVARALKGP